MKSSPYDLMMKNMLRQFVLLIACMRPKQWTKNLLVFPALVFSQNLFYPLLFGKTFAAFLIFCLLSGSLYIVNDLVDLNSDRRHPKKQLRPLASGTLNKTFALFMSLLVLALCLAVSLLLGFSFWILVGSYLLLHVIYSFYLKQIVILDIFSIALSFVLRVFAGAVVISVPVSSWLMICTLSLAFFLGFSKRRVELVSFGDKAVLHRKALGDYSISFLDQMIAVATSSTVLSYALYTISEETIQRFHTTALKYTIPFVMYGIFRYLYLIYLKNEGEEPENILIRDIPMILNILLYILVTGMIVYL